MSIYKDPKEEIMEMLPSTIEKGIIAAEYKNQLKRQQERHQEEMKKAAEAAETREYEERKIKAAEETAANTAMTNERLNKVIDNQNKYIKMLEEQLEVSRSQLQVLRNLFASSEDGVSVEKELYKIIQTQIDETHPLWDYVKDKGGDVVIVGAPVLYKAVKAYLMSKGVLLP